MTMLIMLVVAAAFMFAAGSAYSRFLARGWGEDPGRKTPAEEFDDGRDYVPTPTPIVFAHHFASIAGAGPILGPVLALCFGWWPAMIWVVLGGLLIGGVHDYLAAFMAMRNRGQSVAVMARRLLGRGPFLALMTFLIILLGLVTAVFLNTSASALVSTLDFGRMDLDSGQTLFRVVEADGARKVVIGGIASTSVIIITLFSPLVGWMYVRRRLPVWQCSLAAVLICTGSILAGLMFPVSLPAAVDLGPWALTGVACWKLALAFYVLVAAGIPVWIFLQSRDFINVHILYAGLAALLVTLAAAAVRGSAPAPSEAMPGLDLATGSAKLGMLWPGLFITIACGAISGFHGLCAGGTTCKQLRREPSARVIGYWGMLLESLLAVAVICVLVVGTTRPYYLEDVFPAGRESNPVLGFAFAVGRSGQIAFGLPIAAGALAGMLLLEGFVITTLDTAVRLNRYLIEELWQECLGHFDVFASGRLAPAGAAVVRPVVATRGALRALLRGLHFYWVNSALAVGLMLWLAFSGGILQLWRIFGTANQLLAAFTLGLGAIWLLRNGRRIWYVVLPALFMLATTCASLVMLARKFMPGQAVGGNVTLFAADLALMALTAYIVFAGAREFIARRAA